MWLLPSFPRDRIYSSDGRLVDLALGEGDLDILGS